MVKNHIENKNWREISPKSWHSTQLNEPLQIRIMSSDPETGAMTSIVDLPNTTSSDQILAANCELQIFVLEGELHFDNIHLKPGDYCYYPENSAHGKWHASENTRFILITNKELEFFTPQKITHPTAGFLRFSTFFKRIKVKKIIFITIHGNTANPCITMAVQNLWYVTCHGNKNNNMRFSE